MKKRHLQNRMLLFNWLKLMHSGETYYINTNSIIIFVFLKNLKTIILENIITQINLQTYIFIYCEILLIIFYFNQIIIKIKKNEIESVMTNYLVFI